MGWQICSNIFGFQENSRELKYFTFSVETGSMFTFRHSPKCTSVFDLISVVAGHEFEICKTKGSRELTTPSIMLFFTIFKLQISGVVRMK